MAAVHRYVGPLLNALSWQGIYFDSSWSSLTKICRLVTYLIRFLLTCFVLASICLYALINYVTYKVYPKTQLMALCLFSALCTTSILSLYVYLKATFHQGQYASFIREVVQLHQKYCPTGTGSEVAVSRKAKHELWISLALPLVQAVTAFLMTADGFVHDHLKNVGHALHDHYDQTVWDHTNFICSYRIIIISFLFLGYPAGLQYSAILKLICGMLSDILDKMASDQKERPHGHSISEFHQRHITLLQLVAQADELYSTYYLFLICNEGLVAVIFSTLFMVSTDFPDEVTGANVALFTLVSLVMKIHLAASFNKKISLSLNGAEHLARTYSISKTEQVNQLIFIQYTTRMNANPTGLTVWQCFIIDKELIFTIIGSVLTYVILLKEISG